MPKPSPPPDPTARDVRAPSAGRRPAARAVDRSAADVRADALLDDARILKFLDATAATLSAQHDVATLLKAVIDAATPATGAAFGAIFFRDPPADSGRPASLRAHGHPLIVLSGVHDVPDAGFDPVRTAEAFASAWRARQAVRCGDVTQTLSARGHAALHLDVADRQPLLRSFLAVPICLRSGGAVAGGLFFGHPDADVFDDRTQRIAEGVAAHASIALENACLVTGLRRVASERERLAEAERRARAESMRAGRIKDEFLATLSHELRTPLTAILGWSQVLLRRDDPALRARGLEAIARNASAQAQLIEDLLDMSRIVSGKVKLEMRPTHLAEVVEDAVSALRATAEAKSITLTHRVAPAAARIAGDALRLCQIVWHLVSNAIEFTPSQGRVDVTVERVGGEVQIAVTDTGNGIAPEFLPHVFEHFRQADGSTTRRHGGLGMGLAVVRTLATLHGGTVEAASDGIGRGARFVVRLPAGGLAADDSGSRPDSWRIDSADAAAPSTEAGGAVDARRGARAFREVDLAGLDLLVVDDEPDARELVAQLLVECGATVRQASGAAEAMREFAARPPDVLVSDIGMPERDGYELMREIRRLGAEAGRAVPAVALTAFVQPEDRERAREAGFQTHLAKPVQGDELVATVAGLAGRPAAGK
jgi:signal transduction histidine kinase/CheY-like chemotaxis protein